MSRMKKQGYLAAVIGVLLLSVACQQITGNAPAETSYCAIQSNQTIAPQPETRLNTWNLQATQLKQLTARLLWVKDGKVETVNETVYTWENWSDDEIISGQITLFLQDGTSFGVSDRHLSLLNVTLPETPAAERVEKKTQEVFSGQLESRFSFNASTNPLLPQGSTILYAELFASPQESIGSVSYAADLESVIAMSQGDRTVVAVSLECQPG